MNMRRAGFCTSVVVAAVPVAVNADIVTMKQTGTGAGENVRVRWQGMTIDIFAGQLQYSVSSGTGFGTSMAGTRYGFGADAQYWSGSDAPFTISPVYQIPGTTPGMIQMGQAKAQAIYDIAALVHAAPFDTVVSNDMATAFQIAIWEILIDYDPTIGPSTIDPTHGSVTFTQTNDTALPAGVSSYVAQFVSAVGTNASNPGVVGLANNSYQDTIMTVPAPTVVAICGVGMVVLGVVRPERRAA